MRDSSRWHARGWYWKACGLFILVVAFATPLIVIANDAFETALGMVLLASPFVIWIWRIAAWEEASGLAVRNLFRTKRIPWDTIERLEVSDTFWSPGTTWSGWAYGAVKHNGGKTHIKAMIAIYAFRPESMVAELRELATRNGLSVDESSISELIPSAPPGPKSA